MRIKTPLILVSILTLLSSTNVFAQDANFSFSPTHFSEMGSAQAEAINVQGRKSAGEDVELKEDQDPSGNPWVGSFGGMTAGGCLPFIMLGAGALVAYGAYNTKVDFNDIGDASTAFLALGGGAFLIALGAPSMAICASGGACLGGGLFGGPKERAKEIGYGIAIGTSTFGLASLTLLGGIIAASVVPTQVGPILQYTSLATIGLFMLAGPATATTISIMASFNDAQPKRKKKPSRKRREKGVKEISFIAMAY